MNYLFLFYAVSLIMGGCIPVIVGGGVVTTGVLATREKGVGGTVSDTGISTDLKAKLYKIHPDLHAQVGVSVQSGEVLLTGTVQKAQWKELAEKTAWAIDGVRTVHSYLQVSDNLNLSSIPKDGWITTQIKSKIMVEQDVSSLNYSVKTVGTVVYITGIAKDQTELDKVVALCRNTSGVSKVICLVQLKGKSIG